MENKQRVVTQIETEKILSLYGSGTNRLTISKLVGFSRETVKKVLLKNGINCVALEEAARKEKLAEVVKLYKQGVTQVELEKMFNLTRKTIRELLKQEVPNDYRVKSVAQRTYELNDNCMDDLQDEETAYWIGFLYADGHIYSEDKSENCISLGLKTSDIGHLEKFKKYVGYSGPIKTFPKEDGKYSISVIKIYSAKLIGILRSLGFTSDKTYHGVPPTIYLNNRHFWRGVFDGDGCAAYYMPGKVAMQICGTKETVSAFINFVESKVTVRNKRIPNRVKRNGNQLLHYISYYKEGNKVAALLYTDATIYLNRKKLSSMEQRELTRLIT